MSDYLHADAVLSDCGIYRYVLRRVWDGGPGSVTFVMLNPSTADATLDDPTIRRCVGFAKSWGYGELRVVNLFALRATDPEKLRQAVDPVGPDNDRQILETVAGSEQVVLAWGATIEKWKRSMRLRERPSIVKTMLEPYKPCCLGLTNGGHPKHPLYVPAKAGLQG